MPLVLLVLVEGALRAVGFPADADESTIDLVRCPPDPLLSFVSGRTCCVCASSAACFAERKHPAQVAAFVVESFVGAPVSPVPLLHSLVRFLHRCHPTDLPGIDAATAAVLVHHGIHAMLALGSEHVVCRC